jgi:phosphonate transport system substrate-binding protein
MKMSRRWFLTLALLTACSANTFSPAGTALTIGTIRDDQPDRNYDRVKSYLREKLQSLIEVEPVVNEDVALQKIQAKAWALAFAPPGLAAIAISQFGYKPVLPLVGVQNLRSAIVVLEDSPIQNIAALSGKALAVGQPGSATGYYLPLFNLYGLTLSELFVAATPKEVLEAVAQGKAAAGAMSVAEFDTYRSQVNAAKLRVLFVDPHPIPSGALLISPEVAPEQSEKIQQALRNLNAVMAEEIGLVTNAPVPDYQYLISVVERVRAIFPGDRTDNTALLRQKPVNLFERSAKKNTSDSEKLTQTR